MRLYKLIEKKKRDRRKKMLKTTTTSTIVGGTIGILTGILLAPKSGKETRADIKEKISDARIFTVEKKDKIKRKVEESKIKRKDYLKEKNNSEILEREKDFICEDEEVNICQESVGI